MSHYDRSMAELVCKGCGERHSMRTRQIFNPEQYVMMAERFALEHRGCEKFTNQAEAKRELLWRRLCKVMDAPTRTRRMRHATA
jgi:hypothetical protein